MQEPQIVEKPALAVVGLEAHFISALSPDTNCGQVIGPLWDQFVHRANQIPHRIGHNMVGVIHGRPAAERSHSHELVYIAAVPVGNAASIPAGMVGYTVPAGTFAVFTHRGPICNLEKTLEEAYRVWLPQSSYERAACEEVAEVELYGERFCGGGENSEMEYWIPVVPKETGSIA